MRTYLPRAHGNRQRVCLSHLCCWIGVWRRKEKPFLLEHVPVHPCCPLARLGDGSVPTTHSACSRTAAPLLGTSHTGHSETLLSAAGWGRGHSKRAVGHIQSRVLPSHCCSALSLLPAMVWSLQTHQGAVPNPPFSFPKTRPPLEKAPLSQSRGLQWARAALCLAVSHRPA